MREGDQGDPEVAHRLQNCELTVPDDPELNVPDDDLEVLDLI